MNMPNKVWNEIEVVQVVKLKAWAVCDLFIGLGSMEKAEIITQLLSDDQELLAEVKDWISLEEAERK